MNRFLKNALAFFFFSELCVHAFAFSAKDIISPREGEWNNIQALVLNNTKDAEIYYSLSGSDPLESGFSYDGPVVIDQKGNVKVRITAISDNGKNRQDFTVEYSVCDAPQTGSKQVRYFVDFICKNPVIRYTSGTSMNILPAELFGNQPFFVRSDNIADYYVPFSCSNENAKLNFVVHVVPDSKYLSNKVDLKLPFVINDWEYFSFTDNKFIFKIDDSPEWEFGSDVRKLDRSVPHIISWQSVDYKIGNEIFTYELKAKPSVSISPMEDKRILSVYIDEFNSYSADCFEGSAVSGILKVPYFSDGVLLGTVDCEYFVDKKAPAAPVVESTTENFFSRKKVSVVIKAADEDTKKIKFFVSKPVFCSSSEESFSQCKIPEEEIVYSEYDGRNIVLKSVDRETTFYYIKAVSEDEFGNTGNTAEYSVIVDECNYYLCEKDVPQDKLSEYDGSYTHPFANFDQALEYINSSEDTTLHVVGNIKIKNGAKAIRSNCRISGMDNIITFEPGASVHIENGAKVSFENMIFENDSSAEEEKDTSLFVVNSAILNLTGCEISAQFAKKGIILDCEKSGISFSDCGFTVQANSYACAVLANRTDINCTACRFMSLASTAVCLSAQSVNCRIEKSSFSTAGDFCRGAEFNESKFESIDNVFDNVPQGKKSMYESVHLDDESFKVQ